MGVEPEGRGEAHQIVRVEIGLVLEEQVVHLPEPALRTGRLGCLGRQRRVGMDIDQRQMAEDEAQSPLEPFQQSADHGRCVTAIGAFEVTVLDQRHRRTLRPPDMVALWIDLLGQVPEGPRGLGVGPPEPFARQPPHPVEEHDAEGRRDDRGDEDAELRLIQERADVAELER